MAAETPFWAQKWRSSTGCVVGDGSGGGNPRVLRTMAISEAWASYRKAKISLTKKESTGGKEITEDNAKRDDETSNGMNSRTGWRNRCFSCNGEYQLLSKCPHRGHLGSGAVPASLSPKVSSGPPYPSISLESPVEAQETEESCQKSFSTTLELLGNFSATEPDGVVM